MVQVEGFELNYEKLRASEAKPRLHPNGFVQLDLSDKVRLHIWPDNSVVLPKPKVATVIHDHTFDFQSTILAGRLTNLIYEFNESPDGPWHLYGVKPYAVVKKWVPMILTDNKRFTSRVLDIEVLKKGDSYKFPAFKFHETLWDGLTVTAIRIGRTYPEEMARVACSVNELPDNDFRRDCADPEVMWSLIKRGCELAAR